MKINKLVLLMLGLLIVCLLACTPSSNLSKTKTSNHKTEDKSNSDTNPTTYFVFQEGVYKEDTLDKEPIPIGGKMNFYRTMFKKLNYPPDAREKGIQGKVWVTVIINEFGQLEKASLKKGIGYGCDEEAIAAVIRGCKLGFEPAMKNNIPVKVKYDIPVKFGLV